MNEQLEPRSAEEHEEERFSSCPSLLRGQRTGLAAAGWMLLALLSTSCVYYNGMYNTRHYTSEAEKAERDGRRIDANSAWARW